MHTFEAKDMIARICGKLIEKNELNVLVEVGGICYEVLVPATVMQRLDQEIPVDSTVNLTVYHYVQIDQSRSIPVLIGFLSELEKEFFETFITVSGIGPRAALKALNQPISLIAQAIDEADVDFLKSLPGIGQQRAREIVAKLQHKVGKFCLMQDAGALIHDGRSTDIQEEALAILTQLEYKKQEALQMIKKAMESHSGIETTEQLLNEVYKQRKR